MRAAASLADEVIVTNDNPRSEAPEGIADAVLAGTRGRPARTRCELDRRAAIAMAASEAQPGDVVLVAGKGHETGQQMGADLLPFDDRTVAQEVLS